jgi:hypothetical protein
MHVGTNRSYGPLPGESAFVVAARDSIPSANIKRTTTTVRERGGAKATTGSRGRGRSIHKGEEEMQLKKGKQVLKMQEQATTMSQFQILKLPDSQMKWLLPKVHLQDAVILNALVTLRDVFLITS